MKFNFHFETSLENIKMKKIVSCRILVYKTWILQDTIFFQHLLVLFRQCKDKLAAFSQGTLYFYICSQEHCTMFYNGKSQSSSADSF